MVGKVQGATGCYLPRVGCPGKEGEVDDNLGVLRCEGTRRVYLTMRAKGRSWSCGRQLKPTRSGQSWEAQCGHQRSTLRVVKAEASCVIKARLVRTGITHSSVVDGSADYQGRLTVGVARARPRRVFQ